MDIELAFQKTDSAAAITIQRLEACVGQPRTENAELPPWNDVLPVLLEYLAFMYVRTLAFQRERRCAGLPESKA